MSEYEKAPPTINLNFGSSWRILRPTIYRFLDEQFVDDFLETGKLRLSSFAKFSKHKDEHRLDVHEGAASTLTTDGEMFTFAHSQLGTSCYVLCGSTSRSIDVSAMFGKFAIEIVDVTSFAWEVAKALPNFEFGIEGACIYRAERLRFLERKSEKKIKNSFEEFKDGDQKSLSEIAGGDHNTQLFLKEEKYSGQFEYRLLWQCTYIEDHLDILVPRARQYCRKLKM